MLIAVFITEMVILHKYVYLLLLLLLLLLHWTLNCRLLLRMVRMEMDFKKLFNFFKFSRYVLSKIPDEKNILVCSLYQSSFAIFFATLQSILSTSKSTKQRF